ACAALGKDREHHQASDGGAEAGHLEGGEGSPLDRGASGREQGGRGEDLEACAKLTLHHGGLFWPRRRMLGKKRPADARLGANSRGAPGRGYGRSLPKSRLSRQEVIAIARKAPSLSQPSRRSAARPASFPPSRCSPSSPPRRRPVRRPGGGPRPVKTS